MMRIVEAIPAQASAIATLIMEAMNAECCRYFTGEEYTLGDFHSMMTSLVARQDSQYSFLNTLVALNDAEKVVGVCVSYNGAKLHSLRRPFINACKEHFKRDFSGMDDETAAGELYVDSLAVDARYREKGIATALLKAVVEKGKRLELPAVGLLVDAGNPQAERLYRAVGFRYVGDNMWGGHPMRHLQYDLKTEK